MFSLEVKAFTVDLSLNKSVQCYFLIKSVNYITTRTLGTLQHIIIEQEYTASFDNTFQIVMIMEAKKDYLS